MDTMTPAKYVCDEVVSIFDDLATGNEVPDNPAAVHSGSRIAVVSLPEKGFATEDVPLWVNNMPMLSGSGTRRGSSEGTSMSHGFPMADNTAQSHEQAAASQSSQTFMQSSGLHGAEPRDVVNASDPLLLGQPSEVCNRRKYQLFGVIVLVQWP
ncbi:hypothetical protein V6N11_052035 [Hibiscus sabdariffa]|uniref:Uncharacterized protein n=1 Tax=Hibiscus sabdariffa TaxID=183260 RepID=A0ABR2U8X7_9ROSI